jgi:hypothetical protein
MTDATTEAREEAGITATSTSPRPSFNGWFLSLPAERQAILREDRWMLAEAAFNAGLAAMGGSPQVRK